MDREVDTNPSAQSGPAHETSRSPAAPPVEIAPGSGLWLRRADQATVAALTLVAIILLGTYWFVTVPRGRLIDVDRAPRREAAFLVDINEAEWPELAQLPGIGESLARRIVESRHEEGPFADHDDLERVSGIGPRTVERIRGYLVPMPASTAVGSR